MQLLGADRLALELGEQAVVNHTMVESHGLFGCLQRNSEFARPRCAEIVGHATGTITSVSWGITRGLRCAAWWFMGRDGLRRLRRPVGDQSSCGNDSGSDANALGQIIELVLR
jgi:hypothetical protein